jgi:Mago nashi protein
MVLFTDDDKEFDFRTLGDGRSAAVRYANNSNYRNDSLIRKESKILIAPTYFRCIIKP